MIKEIVETAFDDEIKRVFKDKEQLLKFFIQNDQRKVCVNNVVSQIFAIDLNNKIKLSGDKIRYIAKEMARFWCGLALEAKERELNARKFCPTPGTDGNNQGCPPKL